MNPIKASSLLHFTPTSNGLRGILRNGFRFSYVFEYYPREVIYNELYPEKPVELCLWNKSLIGVAMPMICFCDTPLTRAYSHAKKYGEYIIGIDKNVAITLYHGMLNPVHYYTSDKIYSALVDLSILKTFSKSNTNKTNIQYPITDNGYKIKKVAQHIETNEEKYIFSQNAIESINCLFSLIKPYRGYDLSGKEVCYYDEQEWRIFIIDGEAEENKWIWDFGEKQFCSVNDFKKWIAPQNKILYESQYAYLPITEEFPVELLSKLITHIVVKKEYQIPNLVNALLSTERIFGVDLQKGNKQHDEFRSLLISRISSFERIENDY